MERALRDSSLGGGAAALKTLLERLDGTLPAPECGGCGRPMARHLRASKSFLTGLGRVGVERSYFRCGSCGGGRFPPGRALGLEGDTVTPGTASVIAGTVPSMGFGAARRSGREEVLDGGPPEPRMYLSIDGTGIPMRKEEVAGVRGRQADGTSRSREAKLAVIHTAGGRDPETGGACTTRTGRSSSPTGRSGYGARAGRSSGGER